MYSELFHIWTQMKFLRASLFFRKELWQVQILFENILVKWDNGAKLLSYSEI